VARANGLQEGIAPDHCLKSEQWTVNSGQGTGNRDRGWYARGQLVDEVADVGEDGVAQFDAQQPRT
jgi:hypothetical protein